MRIWAGSRSYCATVQNTFRNWQQDGTCLFGDFHNNKMIHFSTKNGTICLYDYVVFSAIFDDRFLLAEWMKLEVISDRWLKEREEVSTSIWLTEGIS